MERKRRAREICVRGTLEALRHQRYAELEEFLTDDIVISDYFDGQIEGLGNFIAYHRKFREGAGDTRVVARSIEHLNDEVLLRGNIEGGHRDIDAPTIWRIAFRDHRACNIEVLRENNQRTLPSFAKLIASRQPLADADGGTSPSASD